MAVKVLIQAFTHQTGRFLGQLLEGQLLLNAKYCMSKVLMHVLIDYRFFAIKGSAIDARYSTNTDIVLPLQNNYKTFSIMLDKFITPEHSISFDVEFE